MAKLTRAEARALVQQLIDDPQAKLWSADNLDILAEGVLDELWSDLLEHAPYLRSTEYTGTSLPAVNVDSVLTRFFRVQQIVRNDAVYAPADPKDVTVANNEVVYAPDNTWVLQADTLYLFPEALSPDFYLKYSSLPTAFTELATDATEVEWPNGHHLAYIYAIAARAMEKGDREQSERFERRAENAMLKLKAKLRKTHTGPAMPWMPDDAWDWGGM